MNIPVAPRSNLRKFSLFIGLLAGLGYALGTWGIEGIVLAGAHGMYPFLKLAIGALICALAGLLAGWLCRRFANIFFNFIIWGCTGAAFNRIAFYLNFPGLQAIMNRLQPEVGPLLDYSIDYGVSTRGTLMLVITIVACGLMGLFTNLIGEEATSKEGVQRGLSLLLWVVLFLGIGYLGASLNTNPMRDAVISIDQSIRFYNEHTGEDLPNEVKSQMGLFGLKNIEPYLNTPYRLIFSGYDTMLVYIRVLVQFKDQIAICPVINGSTGTCNLVEK